MCLTRDIFTGSISGELLARLSRAASRRGAGAPDAPPRPPQPGHTVLGDPTSLLRHGTAALYPSLVPCSSQEPRQTPCPGSSNLWPGTWCHCHHPPCVSDGHAHGPKPPSSSPKYRLTCGARRKQRTRCLWLVRNASAHPYKVAI